jgi:hypothetical protein
MSVGVIDFLKIHAPGNDYFQRLRVIYVSLNQTKVLKLLLGLYESQWCQTCH